MTEDMAAALSCFAGNVAIKKNAINFCAKVSSYSCLEFAYNNRSTHGNAVDVINEWVDFAFGELPPWSG